MSVTLNPPNALGFRRPLTQVVKRSLTVTNPNSQPVAFKVKTTAPKLYCVRPNSGRVEPGETIEVSVMLQGMKEEPPLNARCKDKFLIQSTLITPEKETMALHDIWSAPETSEETKIHQHKLRVTYQPAEGTVEEEDEPVPAAQPLQAHDSVLNGGGDPSHFDTARAGRSENGHGAPMPTFSLYDAQENQRLATPANDFLPREEVHRDSRPPSTQPQPFVRPPSTQPALSITPQISQTAPAPSFSVPRFPTPKPAAPPAPVPVTMPAPSTAPASIVRPPSSAAVHPAQLPPPQIIYRENPVNEELTTRLRDALADVERLRTELSATKSRAQLDVERLQNQLRESEATLRRRTKALSDDGSVTETDIATVVEEPTIHQEGVPLQIVVAVALVVFVTTYLFF
ncbi:hypothetical protein AX16_008098 [Volvariella volvacea WC 439]|nr:hypothetical protein AX16_008098 [Volvariella volvacea WC 439]